LGPIGPIGPIRFIVVKIVPSVYFNVKVPLPLSTVDSIPTPPPPDEDSAFNA